MFATLLCLLSAVSFSAAICDTLGFAIVESGRMESMRSSVPVQEVSANRIQARPFSGVDELVRSFSGVSVRDYGGVGGMKTVSVRGLGASHTAVCNNGFVVSDVQNGQVDLSRLVANDLSGVRMSTASSDNIMRPARLSLAGSVLEIENAIPDSNSVKVSLMAASFNTWNPSLSVSGVRNAAKFKADAALLRSDGDYPFVYGRGEGIEHLRRENSALSSLKADVMGECSIGKAHLNGRVDAFASDRQLPGAVVMYRQNPTEHLWDREMSASARCDIPMASNLLARMDLGARTAHTRYVNTSALYGLTPLDDRYSTSEGDASMILAWTSDDGRFSASVAEDLVLSQLESTRTDVASPSRIQSYSAVSAKVMLGRLNVTAVLGAQYKHEYAQNGAVADDCKRLSPSLSALWNVGDGVFLRVFCKDGFRVPTFNDLYYQAMGNIRLKPEKAFQSGVGFSAQREVNGTYLTASADLYHNNIRDKIVATPTMFIWYMRNLGRVVMNGADLSFSAHRSFDSSFTADVTIRYSYADARDITDPDVGNYGHQIQYTPRNTASAIASLSTPWFDCGTDICAVGERWYMPQNNDSNRLAPYCDISFFLGRSIQTGLRYLPLVDLRLAAMNILGTNYEIVRSYPMPGRSLRLSIKISII